MALKDNGADEQFYTDLLDIADKFAEENDTTGLVHPEVAAGGFYRTIEYLIDGAHKSDIGVLHRMIRNKLEG